MTYLDTIKSMRAKHYYPLTTNANDVINGLNGNPSAGVTFNNGAVFNGSSFIDLPRSTDFSATQTGSLSILVNLTISNWYGSGEPEYHHWMGKGTHGSNDHEWVFRHYTRDGTGEAPERQGRCSFYAFSPRGGLGAGSFYQDESMPTTERIFVATLNKTYTTLYVNGVQRDRDLLSGYDVVQSYTTAPVRIGTRDRETGYLVGKIRRVAFWNRILTLTEIKTLYTERLTR